MSRSLIVQCGLLAACLLVGASAQVLTALGPRAAQPLPGPFGVVGAGGLHGTAEFAVAGAHEWQAPQGVHAVLVELWGGGGGGSRPYGYQSAGDGGGAGGFVRTVVAVEPGRTYTLVVGAAGLGATPPSPFGTPGAAGGDTRFVSDQGEELAWAGGGSGGNDAGDGHGGLADPGAAIRRDGGDGGHGFGISAGAGGHAISGSVQPPHALGGGMGGAGQIQASGQSGGAGYAVLLW